MAAEVRFSKEAREDLVSIALWVEAAADAAVADAYQARIRNACLSLSDFPRRGTPRSDLGPEVRSVSFERQAVIAYRVSSEVVEIVAIAHRGRDLGDALR